MRSVKNKKILAILLLWLTAATVSAFSLKEWKDSAYNQIRTEAEKAFTGLFQRPVSIESSGGMILGEITLTNVNVPGIGKITKVTLNFNPLKLAFAKGDMLQALTKITINQGTIKIIRDRKDRWNFMALVPKAELGAPPAPAFLGRIAVKDCVIEYYDEVKTFHATARETNGEIDLQKKDKLNLNLSAKLPEAVKVDGNFDLKTLKYELSVSGSKVNIRRWANYGFTAPDLKINGGEADILVKLGPPRIKNWPISLNGKARLYGGDLRFQSFNLKKIDGDLQVDEGGITFAGLNGEINSVPFALKGKLADFSEQNLDLAVTISSANLNKLRSLLPETAGLDLAGEFNADAAVSGTAGRPVISGSATVPAGSAFGQKFGAVNVGFALKINQLSAELQSSNFYHGLVSSVLKVDLGRKVPQVDLQAKFSKLSLFALAQNSAGLEGTADGVFSLTGAADDLKGELSSYLYQAVAFGQPIQSLDSSFTVTRGDFELKDLRIAGSNGSFQANGDISSKLDFDLLAEARGLRIKGTGIFGKMAANIDRFKGEIRLKLDPQFLASPLKNIFASGEVILSDGQMGEQMIDRAQGMVRVGGGKIEIQDTFLQSGSSTLRAEGQTGLGYQTSLKVSGQNIDLADLKILNAFLPAEVRNPSGKITLEAEVSGTIPKETKLSSIDPLLDLSLKGRLVASNCSWGGIPLERGEIYFAWADRSFSISHSKLILPESELSLELLTEKDGNIRASLSGTVDLGLLQPVTRSYGNIDGRLGLTLKVEGKIDDPTLTSSFWFSPIRFNGLMLDSMTGSFYLSHNQLTLLEPLIISDDLDTYSLTGTASPGAVDFELKVLHADLARAYNLAQNLQSEIARRFSLTESKSQKIDLAALRLPSFPDQPNVTLYSSDGKNDYFLKHFGKAAGSNRLLVAAPLEKMGGKLSGSLELNGPPDRLTGKVNLNINKGYFRSFEFDGLVFDADLKDQKIKIGKAVLTKDRGNLTVRGDYSFKNDIFLNLVASDMPLDILKIVWPNKEFKGLFNVNAGLDGPLQDPRITVAAAGSGVELAGVNFDKLTFSFTKRGDMLYLHELSLLEGSIMSSAYGSIDLTRPGKLDLEANLKGNSVGLLNLLTDDVAWLNGYASISAKVQGTLGKPSISGTLNFSDSALQIKALNSQIRKIEGKAVIRDNVLSISSLTGIWVGEKTRDYSNPISLAGNIDLSNAFAVKSSIGFDLVSSPTHLFLAFPNLYSGGLDIKSMSLSGPLALDLSRGPLLKGEINIDNAVITLSQNQPAATAKVFPLNFDLNADLNKNVYVVMGDVSTLNLSNIFMNLEIAGTGMKISGNLAAPVLKGKIGLKRGTVNIFNREFTLLSSDSQKKFYPYDAEKVIDNVAIFTGEEGANGVLPQINIASSVNVENQEKDASGQPVKKNVIILARLDGVPGTSDKDSGLKISLSGFTEDKTKSPSEMVPATYSEQDLKVMLLPDFIKSLAGIGQPGESSKLDTNVVVADYVSSRVQTILFRGLERQAEQQLGLESLTLEYNFGPKVREAMGINDTTGYADEKPAWSVGFVKGLFDRLYVDVRYSQGAQQTTGTSASNTSFNYQLTYKLSQIWSIIYYREPISLTDITTGYQKVTLKAGFVLW